LWENTYCQDGFKALSPIFCPVVVKGLFNHAAGYHQATRSSPVMPTVTSLFYIQNFTYRVTTWFTLPTSQRHNAK
jgi:hypothetical protein